MTKKLLEIPISKHLKKFLLAEFPVKDGAVVVDYRPVGTRYKSYENVRKYFKHPSEDFDTLLILSKQSKLSNIYFWVKQVNELFHQRMTNYIAVRDGIMSNRAALHEFLALYKIYEEDYKPETAYKKWQRSKAYQHLRKQNGSNQPTNRE